MWKIHIKSGHNFAHGMTAELSCHVQNYGLIRLSETKLEQNAFSPDVDYELNWWIVYERDPLR